MVSFHPFRPGGDGHVSAGYLRTVDADASQVVTRLEPTADDLAAASRVLAESKCDAAGLVVIFPGSGSPAKNWPAHKFAALAAMLAKGSGILRSADSALNDKEDGQKDKEYYAWSRLGRLKRRSNLSFARPSVPVLKDLDLPTVAAVARLASAFVGNDSGVAHLAAAVGTPGVAIFGPTDPARWRPLGPGGGAQITILRRVPIDSIEPREVAGALSKFVERRQRY